MSQAANGRPPSSYFTLSLCSVQCFEVNHNGCLLSKVIHSRGVIAINTSRLVPLLWQVQNGDLCFEIHQVVTTLAQHAWWQSFAQTRTWEYDFVLWLASEYQFSPGPTPSRKVSFLSLAPEYKPDKLMFLLELISAPSLSLTMNRKSPRVITSALPILH